VVEPLTFGIFPLGQELFTLRDAGSSRDGIFYNFGIMRNDYSPKPAYTRLRSLIAELGRPA
jgi:hypothetical protein